MIRDIWKRCPGGKRFPGGFSEMISVESREHRLAHLPGHISIGYGSVAERDCFRHLVVVHRGEKAVQVFISLSVEGNGS